MNILEKLKQRGMIKQTVFEEELTKRLEEPTVFYCGFDPTADSLHIGHYIPVMAMAHMQRAGHKPILLMGGGTAMIGDPTGRTDMRNMLSREDIDSNVARFKKQLSRLISFEGENAAIFANNADWLMELNYVDFIRDIGCHFSVNKMLTAECFKMRLEKGLSFLEFNYMLMQGYDFLKLYQDYGCRLQIGGDDQWSNILAGADLIRRKEGAEAYCFTLPLLLSSSGAKMGKTAKGALWLDAEKTTPYEFYQYFRNVEDEKVEECLRLLTFLELEEIYRLTEHKDERINSAKKVLAFEVTKLIHGEDAAVEAEKQALAAFSGAFDKMSRLEIPAASSTLVADILALSGGASSKSEARRLIEGGGVRVEGKKVESPSATLADMGVLGGEFILQKGKKFIVKICLT